MEKDLRRDAEDRQNSRSRLSNMMKKTPYRRTNPLRHLQSYLLSVQRCQFQGMIFAHRVSCAPLPLGCMRPPVSSLISFLFRQLWSPIRPDITTCRILPWIWVLLTTTTFQVSFAVIYRRTLTNFRSILILRSRHIAPTASSRPVLQPAVRVNTEDQDRLPDSVRTLLHQNLPSTNEDENSPFDRAGHYRRPVARRLPYPSRTTQWPAGPSTAAVSHDLSDLHE
jgi:hypothetical protein